MGCEILIRNQLLGKEGRRSRNEQKIRLQCRFDKALPSSWGPLEQQWPVTVALGHAEMARSCLPCSVTWWGLPRKCLPLGEAGLCCWGRPWRIWQLVAVRRKCQLTTHFTARQPDLPWRRIWETHLPVFQSLRFAPFRSTFHLCFKGGSFKTAVDLSSWEII